MAKYALVMRIINLKCSFQVLAISRLCFNIVLIFFLFFPVSCYQSVRPSVSLSLCLSFCPSVSLSVCQTVRQPLSPSVCLTQSVTQTQSGWQSVSMRDCQFSPSVYHSDVCLSWSISGYPSVICPPLKVTFSLLSVSSI